MLKVLFLDGKLFGVICSQLSILTGQKFVVLFYLFGWNILHRRDYRIENFKFYMTMTRVMLYYPYTPPKKGGTPCKTDTPPM